MKKYSMILALGVAASSVGCDLNQDDYTLSGGNGIYVTLKKTPSAQLLLVLKAICKDDGACVMNLMRAKNPTFSIGGFGQAEYNEALDNKYAGQLKNAINAVQSVNAPAACVRVHIWKVLWPFLETHAEWYATNENCYDGGNILD